MFHRAHSCSSYATWLLMLLLVTLATNVQAHPFHISLAEVEYNPKTGKFEVSLKVHVSDLERALSITAKRNVNLEKDSEADKLLAEYASQHFFLTSADNLQAKKDGNQELKPEAEHSQLKFIGKEIESTWLWLYAELEYPAPPESGTTGGDNEPITAPENDFPNLVLVNTILLDVTDSQINTISIRVKDKKYSFKTTLKQPWAKLPGLNSK